MIYILWAFFIGDMAPQPIQLSTYDNKKSCETEKIKVKKDVHWDRWNFSCISSKPHKE